MVAANPLPVNPPLLDNGRPLFITWSDIGGYLRYGQIPLFATRDTSYEPADTLLSYARVSGESRAEFQSLNVQKYYAQTEAETHWNYYASYSPPRFLGEIQHFQENRPGTTFDHREDLHRALGFAQMFKGIILVRDLIRLARNPEYDSDPRTWLPTQEQVDYLASFNVTFALSAPYDTPPELVHQKAIAAGMRYAEMHEDKWAGRPEGSNLQTDIITMLGDGLKPSDIAQQLECTTRQIHVARRKESDRAKREEAKKEQASKLEAEAKRVDEQLRLLTITPEEKARNRAVLREKERRLYKDMTPEDRAKTKQYLRNRGREM